MSVSNDYFGTPNQSPNLNQLFESARTGVQQGMGIVNAYNNAAPRLSRPGNILHSQCSIRSLRTASVAHLITPSLKRKSTITAL